MEVLHFQATGIRNIQKQLKRKKRTRLVELTVFLSKQCHRIGKGCPIIKETAKVDLAKFVDGDDDKLDHHENFLEQIQALKGRIQKLP